MKGRMRDFGGVQAWDGEEGRRGDWNARAEIPGRNGTVAMYYVQVLYRRMMSEDRVTIT